MKLDESQAFELQRMVVHHDDSYGPPQTYFRSKSDRIFTGPDGMTLLPGQEISGLTFYNAFTIHKWRDSTSVSSVFLRLAGEGRVKVSVSKCSADGLGPDSLGVSEPEYTLVRVDQEPLFETNVDLGGQAHIDLRSLELGPLGDGLLFFQLQPEGEGLLRAASWMTLDRPLRQVKLGLVITHFNRQLQVRRAASRISAQLLSDSDFHGNISLTIVDNSNNCGISPEAGLTVLPNCNYGGSGGFSRGLLELWDDGSYSHCLFMDDDASCEVESLRRAYRVLQFSRGEKLAVAGSLVCTEPEAVLYEKGAFFDGMCHTIHRGLDMRDPLHLVLAERESVRANYGGWWFFGFSLASIERFPFPFFVRGDDVSFAIVNQLEIFTLNGIAAYGDSFESKHTAMTAYLDARGHLAQRVAMLGHGRLRVLAGFTYFFLIGLLSNKYGSARAACLAAQDVIQGPGFFVENMDMQARFPVLRDLARLDAGQPCNRPPDDLVIASRENDFILRKALRFVTLNGLLVPGFMLIDSPVFQRPGFKATLKQVYRHRSIYCAPTPMSAGALHEMDHREALSCAVLFLRVAIQLLARFGRVRREYRKELPGIMSAEFWRRVYTPTQGGGDREGRGQVGT